MGIDCYYHPYSSPCRAVLLAAKNMGLMMNLKLTNIYEGEQHKPEFLKMNPNHAVPTLDDDGFYVYDSRSILQYLANAYGKTDRIYPKDPKKRWMVDQRLLQDLDTYQAFANVFFPPVFFKQKIDPGNVKKLDEALGKVNKYLELTRYFAGETLTIADFSISATLSTIQASGHDTETNFPAIRDYIQRMKYEMEGWLELNQQGADQFGEFMHQALLGAYNKQG